jgi:hypothetical protein
LCFELRLNHYITFINTRAISMAIQLYYTAIFDCRRRRAPFHCPVHDCKRLRALTFKHWLLQFYRLTTNTSS